MLERTLLRALCQSCSITMQDSWDCSFVFVFVSKAREVFGLCCEGAGSSNCTENASLCHRVHDMAPKKIVSSSTLEICCLHDNCVASVVNLFHISIVASCSLQRCKHVYKAEFCTKYAQSQPAMLPLFCLAELCLTHVG